MAGGPAGVGTESTGQNIANGITLGNKNDVNIGQSDKNLSKATAAAADDAKGKGKSPPPSADDKDTKKA